MHDRALTSRLEQDGIDSLWVIYHDYSGRACGKIVPRDRFNDAIEQGVVFARANLDFTVADQQADGAAFLANTGDFLAVPDPASYAALPYRRGVGRVHAFMRQEDGSPWEGCPRTRLQRLMDAYADRGLRIRASFEPEFILLEPTPDGDHRPVDADGMFTVAGLERHHDLWQQVLDSLSTMGVSMEQLGKEYGSGQFEGTWRHAEPIRAVDDYLTYKDVVKSLARMSGLVASFMPKPFAHFPGSGLHVHLSLCDAGSGRDLTAGESEDVPLSKLASHFVAGLLGHAAGLAGVGSPIVNSYKRLLPGSWAPAHVCWGVGNRAALVRIPGMGRRRHIEFRSGDNAANPYLFLGALLAAGLDGIAGEHELPPPVEDDVGHLSTSAAADRGLALLPRTLPEALNALEADTTITQALGPVIPAEFLKVKRAELAAYDRFVHPWERQTYLDVT